MLGGNVAPVPPVPPVPGVSQVEREQGGLHSVRAVLGKMEEAASGVRTVAGRWEQPWLEHPGQGRRGLGGHRAGLPTGQLPQHRDCLGPSLCWLQGGAGMGPGHRGQPEPPPGGLRGETGQVVPWGSRRERSQDLWGNGWCCGSDSELEHPRVLLLPCPRAFPEGLRFLPGDIHPADGLLR